MHKLDRLRRANALVSEANRSDPSDESVQAPVLYRGSRRAVAEPEPQPFVWPENVRFSRTPDKLRKAAQAERERAAEPVVEAAAVEAVAPPAEPAASPSRVRFWRTPDHLIKSVWGAPEGEDASLADAPSTPDAEPDDALAPVIDEPFEVIEEVVWSGTVVEAEEATTPLAFISDHAFWECVPEAERDDAEFSFETVAPPAAWAAPAAAAVVTVDAAPQAMVQASPEPMAKLPEAAPLAVAAPVTAPAWSGMGWGQSYQVSLQISAPSWAAPAAEMLPVENDVPPPVEVAITAKPGVPLARNTRPPVEPEPVVPEPVVAESVKAVAPFKAKPRLVELPVVQDAGFQLPPIEFLAEPPQEQGEGTPIEVLQQNAGLLEGVLEDFNIRGEIVQACPGPVVTLYELEPAPGIKSSRVISLADDIARSMSAVSARVAVVQGKNAIGIELPNARRETVFLRELLASQDFEATKHKLALCLGKTIGGEPVIADLARMPHLLVAGTTGSGKSVAINTMILSILYRLKPEECRLIMVDPKMLELSVYDGIPHLLTPVVTDPKKAVVALKWAVREMEERYKKMSKLSVRNIDGFNARVQEAKAAGEVITRTVQTGFDKHSGEAIYEEEVMDLEPLPYIVVIVDEMADLMMVAGKEIEGTIQRLAQMARAAGIHVVLATQRPSVDVITGTIKANFPTRISFQVTSKIDSRTILGEMGAEQLLGQGDMLYMAGGGRITRVHGPFVSDAEVEKVVAHLKTQGRPQYLDAVTSEEEEGAEDEDGAVFDKTGMGAVDSDDPYEQAVAVVLRDRKASTSYIQRRLQIGYNRAASIMERMENEGIVGPANHAGKREILADGPRQRDDED
ncbi:Cell division protein FtsK [Hyphomicrobiales bacterium]|nr:Cell division protein FtsK [Hyphomicrobiales bacterium]CAH1697516.1 Cell division protein FtsK [Hyphomicrobiales bacterium]